MPNSLVHFAIQGITTKSLFRNVDMQWVLLGCIIPDIPWIVQRMFYALLPQIDPYMLRAYVIVQASLIFCLLLSAMFAFLSEKRLSVFIILSVNSLLHLLLDSLEIKPGAGVHLFAPFSWDLLAIGLVWPEHIIVTSLMAIGLICLAAFIFIIPLYPVSLNISFSRNSILALFFLSAYVVLPFFLMSGPVKYDNHFVKTLQEQDNREGQSIQIDRAAYYTDAGRRTIHTFAGEELTLKGHQLPGNPGTVSISGKFLDEKTIQVFAIHENHGLFRDLASYAGLLLFLILWVKPLFRSVKSTSG